MILASGAKTVIAKRLNGFKPADLVIVSLIGPVGESNFTVYANPESSYDWRWTVDLTICLYTNQNTPWRDAAMSIARNRPAWLGLWDVDAFEGTEVYARPVVEDIEKPQAKWRWQLEFIPWLPFQNHQFAWGA